MLIAALALLAAAEDPQVVDGVIVRPDWLAVPGIEHIAPPVMRTEYAPHGMVRLLCVVAAEGRLDGCTIASAPDAFPELGDLALRASEHFRHQLKLKDGRSALGMKIRVTMVWHRPD